MPTKKIRYAWLCPHKDRKHSARGGCHSCYTWALKRYKKTGQFWYGTDRKRAPGYNYQEWLELKELGVSLEEAAFRLGIKKKSLKRTIARHEAKNESRTDTKQRYAA